MITRIVFFLLSLIVFAASAREYSSTGFFYPLKDESPDFSTCGRWLERYPPNGCYDFKDTTPQKNPLYHTGSDMMAPVGTPVYAIADGIIKIKSSNGWGIGTEGANNKALLIEHKTMGGIVFRAIYGHITTSKNAGDSVKAGDQIGAIGPWPNGNHLHFGILASGLSVPATDPNYMGRWLDARFGVKENNYYDNGLIDPIWFITHNAPDNYLSRAEVSQSSLRTPIPPTNPWFPQLCANSSPPDSRCLGEDVVAYIECLYENSDLCAPRVKDYSALKGGGSGSGTAYGGGGGGVYNLNQDFDIINPATGQEIVAGTKDLVPGQVVNLRVQLISEGGDVRNFVKPGKDKVETDYYVRFGGGNWVFIQRMYTKTSNLAAGTHTETVVYTIPRGVSEISFRVKVDATNEVNESNESDNWSRIETFSVYYRTGIHRILRTED